MRLSLFVSLHMKVCPTYASFVTWNKAEGYWGEFLYLLCNKHKSAGALGGVAMREKSQTYQFAFCLERDSSDLCPPCSISQAQSDSWSPQSSLLLSLLWRGSCAQAALQNPRSTRQKQIPARRCVVSKKEGAGKNNILPARSVWL